LPNGSLEFLKKERETHNAPAEKKVDPTKDLTFNLKLTDQEKAAKESVMLPYTHHLNKGATIVMDEPDDDEEDPDDDLEL
jgi:elongator complex protein 5